MTVTPGISLARLPSRQSRTGLPHRSIQGFRHAADLIRQADCFQNLPDLLFPGFGDAEIHILPNAGIEELASLRDEDYRVAKGIDGIPLNRHVVD